MQDEQTSGMAADLASVRAEVFARFAAAAADRASAFRTPTLATVDEDGVPQVRSVVLRSFDPAARSLTFHTDLRSAKVAELRAHPAAAVALHVWDAAAQVQVRVRGAAELHSGPDDDATAAWLALPSGSRATYAVLPGPGTVLPAPDAYAPAPHGSGGDPSAYANFLVVAVTLTGMDWLSLAGPQHRRARFVWCGDRESGFWVVP